MIRKTITALTAMVLLATTMSYAYADNAVVTGFPFEVTVIEGGSIIFTNNENTRWDFVSYGWFEGTVEPDTSLTIDLPITDCGTTCFFADDYYIKDLATGQYSILHIVKPIVQPTTTTTTVTVAEPEMVNEAIIDSDLNLVGNVDTGDTRATIRVYAMPEDSSAGYFYSPNNDMAVTTTTDGNFIAPLKSFMDKYPESNSYRFDLEYNGVQFERVMYYKESVTTKVDYVGNDVVSVYVFPFDVEVKVGGSVAIWNMGESVLNLNGYNGYFQTMISQGNQAMFGLNTDPATCSFCFPVGSTHYITDQNTGLTSSITIVSGEEVQVIEEVQVNEVIALTTTESTTTESTTTTTNSTDGIYNVTLTDSDPDVITLQLQLAEVTGELNKALETIGLRNNEITSLNTEISQLNTQISEQDSTILTMNGDISTLSSEVDSLTSQLIIANSTAVDNAYVEQLESQVISITADRDQWKQLANSWYAVAMEQLRVMVEILGL